MYDLKRVKVKRILSKKEHLRKKIEDSIVSVNGQITFNIDASVVENVLLKLARGHAAFETSRLLLEKPKFFYYKPLHLLTDIERENIFSTPEVEIYPEVGSRLFNHLVLINATPYSNWVKVQEDDYLYLVTSQVDQFSVRIVICNYLAVEVI